jgi:hypothetical protein
MAGCCGSPQRPPGPANGDRGPVIGFFAALADPGRAGSRDGGPNFFTSDHVPLHFEGWADFSESRTDLERAFAAAGLSERLRLPIPGRTLELGEP